MNYQIRFSKLLVEDLMNNRASYDSRAIADLLNKIEKQAIKNIESRTIISIGQTKLIEVVMDDILEALKGDDDG